MEKYAKGNGETEYQCRTSEVIVERMSEYIETDRCVSACGVDRNSVGISSDSLLEPQFTAKLCSSDCYHNCPNVIDLYFNLAAGEGKSSSSSSHCRFLLTIFHTQTVSTRKKTNSNGKDNPPSVCSNQLPLSASGHFVKQLSKNNFENCFLCFFRMKCFHNPPSPSNIYLEIIKYVFKNILV